NKVRCARRRAVPHGHGMACLQQVQAHRPPHQAESDKSNFSGRVAHRMPPGTKTQKEIVADSEQMEGYANAFLDRFGALRKGQQRNRGRIGCAQGASRGGRFCVFGFRGLRRFSGSFFRGFLGLFDLVNVLVGNFPAEVASLAALFDVLLQKDRTSGIRRKGAGSGQQDIAYAVLYSDPAAEELGERRHACQSAKGVKEGSIVRTGCYLPCCGKADEVITLCFTTRSPARSTHAADATPYPT